MATHRLQLSSIFFIYSLDSFGIAIAYPIFTPLFLNPNTPFFQEGTPTTYRFLLLGLLLALFPIAQFFSVPFIGDFSDRIGRKKTFSFTLAGSALSYLVAALGIHFHSLVLLCISRFFNGIFAGNTSLCFASLSDLSATDQERSKNFGLMAAFGGISFFLSILSGELFFNAAGPNPVTRSLPFALISLLSWSAFFFMLKNFQDLQIKTKKARFHFSQGYHHILSSLQSKNLKSPYLTYFFFAIAWSAVSQFYPSVLFKVYNKAPIAFTLNLLSVGLIWSLANFLAQRFLAKHLSPKQILWMCIPLLFFSLMACTISQSYLSFSLHFSFAVFVAALTWTNTFANVSLNAPKEVQGRIMGINQSFASIATILAAIGGALSAILSPLYVLFFGSLCLIFSFFFLQKKTDQP